MSRKKSEPAPPPLATVKSHAELLAVRDQWKEQAAKFAKQADTATNADRAADLREQAAKAAATAEEADHLAWQSFGQIMSRGAFTTTRITRGHLGQSGHGPAPAPGGLASARISGTGQLGGVMTRAAGWIDASLIRGHDPDRYDTAAERYASLTGRSVNGGSGYTVSYGYDDAEPACPDCGDDRPAGLVATAAHLVHRVRRALNPAHWRTR